jgi:hypothetical protein
MTKMRNGFLRVKGPFEGPEEAGIILLVGFFLSLWLWFISRSGKRALERRYLGLRRSTLCVGGILLGLFMTLSRGPWLGAAAGFLIAQIGLAKNRRLAIIAALVLGGIGGALAHNKAEEYSNRAKEYSQIGLEGLSETQTSALYRTHLYDTYRPTAERGGLFGLSAAAFPKIQPYDSIDNEYLYLWVTQGKVGISLFVLIVMEGSIAIILAILHAREQKDACFYYCLAGMLAGLLIVLITVYMSWQPLVLFFSLHRLESIFTRSIHPSSTGIGTAVQFPASLLLTRMRLVAHGHAAVFRSLWLVVY